MPITIIYPRALLSLTALLLACGKTGDIDTDTIASTSTSGEDTLGMGETSVAPTSDPTMPTTTVGTTTETTATTATTTSGSPSDPSTVSITTDPDTTTLPDPSSPTITTTSTSTSTTDDTSGETTSTTTGVECSEPPQQPQDSACTDASGCGCASGNCFLIPILGGWCGECLVDADCGDGGCTIPNPIGNTGALCNLGKEGDGCQSDTVCSQQGFEHCGVVLKVEGLFTTSTCGECKTNADCPGNAPNCSPDYDLDAFSGTFRCVADGSVPNNAGCNLQDDGMGAPVGNKACQSGFCGEASVMGLLKMGICGECNSNADCNPGETCSDPLVDLDQAALLGSVCL